jgi:hypothetical protein
MVFVEDFLHRRRQFIAGQNFTAPTPFVELRDSGLRFIQMRIKLGS